MRFERFLPAPWICLADKLAASRSRLRSPVGAGKSPGEALTAECAHFRACSSCCRRRVPPLASAPACGRPIKRPPPAGLLVGAFAPGPSRFAACGGTGVEPATSRVWAWCSATELTHIEAAIVRPHVRNAPGELESRLGAPLARRHQRFAKDLLGKYPDLDSNQGLNLRRVQCIPLHHRDNKSRRLDSHQHLPIYKTGAFLCRATSAKHEREESNPVRQFWRLAALPGAHSCKLAFSSPTRNRTRNTSLGPRDDLRFTIGL